MTSFVAIIIASEGNKFLVKAGKGLLEWLPSKESLESYNGISLIDNKICKLPDYEIHVPHLTIFLIFKNKLPKISDEFIGGMTEVRVLDISWNEITKLPQSLKQLTKLRVLDIRGNESLDEISKLGELKDLEILIICETRIKEIPKEIGQLVNLRRFDVSECQHLSYISPGVLLKLCSLEELCIGFFKMMQVGDIYDRLIEVMKLSKLTYLFLHIPFYDVIPKGFNLEKLNGFEIQIGGYNRMPFVSGFVERVVVCYNPYDPNSSLESENMNDILIADKGLNKVECMLAEVCPNIRWLVDWDKLQTFHSSKEHQLGDIEEKTDYSFFTKLKRLYLSSLDSLEVVWKYPDEYISLRNLVNLNIVGCNKLVRLFSVCVAQGLVNLESIFIAECAVLEEVIWGGDDADIIIVFPSLIEISLLNLKSMKSFSSGNSTIKYPSLVEVKIINCNRMEKWGNGIHETPNLKFVNKHVPLEDGPNAINDVIQKSF